MKKHNKMKVVLSVVTALWLLSAIILPDKDWAVLVKIGLSLVELFLLLGCLKNKNNIVKVVLVTMLAFMVLTWILPAAYYSGEYIDQGRTQMGLFDLFNYPLTALSYFGYISLFVLMVGGFYGILHKIPAYRSFLDKIVSITKGKEGIALVSMIVLLAVITSVCGLQLGLILFFPMLASVILLMGYDKIVVALTLVGSTMIGVAGTTYGYSNVNILNSVFGLEMSDNVFVKVVILLAGLVLLIFNTLMYAKYDSNRGKATLKAEKKVVKTEKAVKEEVVEKKQPVKKAETKKKTTKSSTAKSTKTTSAKAVKSSTKKAAKGKSSAKSSRKDIKAAAKGEDVIVVKESLVDSSLEKFVPTVVDSKHKIWPIVAGFSLLFVIMVLAFIPWYNSFALEAFTKATTAVSEFELFGFPIFGKLLGTVNAFGDWAITDLFLVMAAIILLLAVIYKVNIDDLFEGFANGIKKALIPAFVILVVYSCLVITTYHPFQLAIYKALLGITDGFNVVTTSIVAILTGLFNQDPSYAFQAAAPYFAGVVTNAEAYPIAAILFQSVYGVTMLVAPTSLILTGVLSYLGISFKDWFKAIWKLLVELLVVLLLVFTILVLI